MRDQLIWGAGGKGLNVSRVLHHLGLPTLAFGCVGGTTGFLIKEMIKEERIPFQFILGRYQTRINITIMDPQQKKSVRILSKGEAVASKDIRALRQVFCKNLPSASMAVLSGRLASGVQDSLYFELITLAQRQGVPCFLDAHGPVFKLGLKAKPFAIKPNRKEAEWIVGEKLNSLKKIKQALKYFFDLGVKIVLLSLGPQGAMATEGSQVWLASPPEIKGGHGVGCGDALLAGFIFSLQKKLSFPQALQLAVAAGTANMLALKPGDIWPQDIYSLLNKVKIRNV